MMPTSNYWLWGEAIPAGATAHQAGRALLGRMFRVYTGEEMPEISLDIYGKPHFLTGNLLSGIRLIEDSSAITSIMASIVI